MGRQSLYQRISDEIITLIETGIYKPESHLPAERELVKKFNVSRAVIREALITLQGKGIIEIKVGVGAYILKRPKYGLHGSSKFDTLELVETCALIEAEAAALAASMITDEKIHELQSYVEIMALREASTMTPIEAGSAFHHAIAEATNNNIIISIVESIYKMWADSNQLQKVYGEIEEIDCGRIVKQHMAILEALKERNPAAARESMRAHFSYLTDALLTASEEKAHEELKLKISAHRSRFLLSTTLAHG